MNFPLTIIVFWSLNNKRCKNLFSENKQICKEYANFAIFKTDDSS